MTTAFGKPKEFWAVDSRWTFKLHNKPVDDHPTKKFVAYDSEIVIFAGDENPILVEQASILELIDHADYMRLIGNLTDETLETIVVSEDNGMLIEFNGDYIYGQQGSTIVNRRQRASNLFHIGSGGKHACDFFHYACRKKRFLSSTGCNVYGSICYASSKDPATGGDPTVKVWVKGDRHGCLEKYKEFSGEMSSYKTYVYEKVSAMLDTLNEELDLQLSARSSISSAHCSSNVQENGTLRKVSFGSTVSRLQRREERKAARRNTLKAV